MSSCVLQNKVQMHSATAPVASLRSPLVVLPRALHQTPSVVDRTLSAKQGPSVAPASLACLPSPSSGGRTFSFQHTMDVDVQPTPTTQDGPKQNELSEERQANKAKFEVELEVRIPRPFLSSRMTLTSRLGLLSGRCSARSPTRTTYTTCPRAATLSQTRRFSTL